MAVGAERLKVLDSVVVPVLIDVVYIQLAGVLGDKATPLAVVLHMVAVFALTRMDLIPAPPSNPAIPVTASMDTDRAADGADRRSLAEVKF